MSGIRSHGERSQVNMLINKLITYPWLVGKCPSLSLKQVMTKIQIYVSNHNAYIWSVQGAASMHVRLYCVHSFPDVTELRMKHRICGTLIGTLPHLTQQNFFLGLPLLLMPEEVVLLFENGEP